MISLSTSWMVITPTGFLLACESQMYTRWMCSDTNVRITSRNV